MSIRLIRNNQKNIFTQGQSGFSLVELMVVLGIVAILAAIATPNITSRRSGYQLKGAARELYSIMQKARVQAIKSNQKWGIVFDSAGNRYLLCSGPGSDGVWSNTTDNPTVTTINLNSYQGGVRYGHGNAGKSATGSTSFPADDISYNSNVATFNPDGTASGGYVYLQNNVNTAYAVGSLTSGVITLRISDGSGWQ